MKRSKLLYVAFGFVAGIFYIAACGTTGQSIAAAIGNALDVVFDNGSSGLTATNVQGAIDEVNTKVATLESATASSGTLAGSWAGTEYWDEGAPTEGLTLVLNDDGTYTCAGGGPYFTNSFCQNASSWELIGDRVLHLNSTDNAYRYFSILSVSSTNLTLNPIGASIFIQLARQ